MTKQVLFIQGGGAGTYDEWDNKLVDSLQRELGPGYSVSYPRMPDEGDPGYAAWKAALLEEIGRLDDGAVLVGHSIGGTFLINTLAEAPPKRQLAGVFLIAPPFAGPAGGRCTASRPRWTWAQGGLPARPSICTTAARTTPCRGRMSICMRKRYLARSCIGLMVAITSSMTTWPSLPRTSAL
jgi:pimeloyl-ACP methyl ester carboxylesterase